MKEPAALLVALANCALRSCLPWLLRTKALWFLKMFRSWGLRATFRLLSWVWILPLPWCLLGLHDWAFSWILGFQCPL
jgi:hypothetical protein